MTNLRLFVWATRTATGWRARAAVYDPRVGAFDCSVTHDDKRAATDAATRACEEEIKRRLDALPRSPGGVSPDCGDPSCGMCGAR